MWKGLGFLLPFLYIGPYLCFHIEVEDMANCRGLYVVNHTPPPPPPPYANIYDSRTRFTFCSPILKFSVNVLYFFFLFLSHPTTPFLSSFFIFLHQRISTDIFLVWGGGGVIFWYMDSVNPRSW
jgi:hypothetical protein